MMIEIASSGGMAGLAARPSTKQVDVSAQDEAHRAAYCELFDLGALSALAERPGNPSAADMQTYVISVTDDAEERHVFTLREDVLPPKMLDLIDEM